MFSNPYPEKYLIYIGNIVESKTGETPNRDDILRVLRQKTEHPTEAAGILVLDILDKQYQKNKLLHQQKIKHLTADKVSEKSLHMIRRNKLSSVKYEDYR